MLISTEQIHRQLDLVEGLGWDSPPGRELLELMRSQVVRPLVRRSGLRGPDADEAEATGWATAWEVLRRPSARSASNPAGMVWIAVRRAVLSDAARRSGDPARWAPASGGDMADSPDPAAPDAPMGSLLSAVIVRLVEAGWDRSVVCQVVVELADTVQAAADSGPGRVAWRRVARSSGVQEWQVRRLSGLLVGTPSSPGLLELLALRGPEVLDDPATGLAIASTTRRWAATPEESLRSWVGQLGVARAVGAGGAAGSRGEPAERAETKESDKSGEARICLIRGTPHTVPPDRSPVGARGAWAAGLTSAQHGGFDGCHPAQQGPPVPDSTEHA